MQLVSHKTVVTDLVRTGMICIEI